MRTLVFLAALSSFAFADTAKTEPGLAVTYTAFGKGDTTGRPISDHDLIGDEIPKRDTTTSRLAALYVPKGAPATPFVPAGPFKAVFTGDIDSPLRADVTFFVKARGVVKVSINGAPALDDKTTEKSVQLSKGANRVVVEFTSDGTQDAQLQLDWASKEFPREPVPPTAWTHAAAPEQSKVREGRMLFATRHCTACHDAGNAVPKDGTGMPELLSTAPDLMDAGARFRPEWVAAWVENPRALRHDATMPNLGVTKEQAADIAAYLATLGTPAKAPVIKADADAALAGGGLFANLGCVACHTTPNFDGKDEHSRTPLKHVTAKFHPVAFTEFLKMPGMHNPWTRMPNFRLTDTEVAQLTAFLHSGDAAKLPEVKGDAARGKIAAASCAACHTIPGVEKSIAAPTLAVAIKSPAKGCLSTQPGKAPDFGFTPAQREALTAFLATDLVSLKQDTFADFAERQIRHMNCTACHPSDGRQSTFQHLEEEIAKLTSDAPKPPDQPEGATVPATAIPQLTWLGEKLQPGWMGSFIAGAAPYKPRPWLASRMPGFGAPGVGIANGLAHQHGLPLADAAEPAADKARAEIGTKLINADGGFNCVQCHGVKDQEPTAVFEAPGINLGYSTERLRKGYFHRWLLAPLRIDAETKMPKFSEDGITTQLSDILGGKAPDQFDAMWQSLRSLK